MTTKKSASKTKTSTAKKLAKKAVRAAKSAVKGAKMPRSKADREAQAQNVHERMGRAIPTPKVELDHQSAWQLLIATILSAQSTDKMVNRVTPHLFARWPTPESLAAADQEEVEVAVKSTGFFRNKAKAIRGASAAITEHFAAEVPQTMAELITLPGVARKTANVVLGFWRKAEGIVVDTHAGRVSRRLGLTDAEDPEGVEQALMALFPKEHWIDTGHRLVLHGRYICTARAPRCAQCPLNELCPSREAEAEAEWIVRADRERAIVTSRGED